MEKEHFKDRPEQSRKLISIEYCMKYKIPVLICIKPMQPSAKDLSDLTMGYITKILTKHDHPRGIKCIVSQPSNGLLFTGRVVYIVKDGWILTDDGWKRPNDVNKK